jgi:hypothetical protein
LVERTPLVVVLAGPNGAGKSTTAAKLLQEALAVDEFVNADTIAQGLRRTGPTRFRWRPHASCWSGSGSWNTSDGTLPSNRRCPAVVMPVGSSTCVRPDTVST